MIKKDTKFMFAHKSRFKIDDPVDAVAVHCGPGALGLMANPLLK